MLSEPLIWKTHKHKIHDFENCPHCGAELRWIYDDFVWLPCDKQPTLFILHPQGKKSIVYNRKVYENCLEFKKGDNRFLDCVPLQGNIQHYYTCPILRQMRRDYINRIKSGKNYLEE